MRGNGGERGGRRSRAVVFGVCALAVILLGTVTVVAASSSGGSGSAASEGNAAVAKAGADASHLNVATEGGGGPAGAAASEADPDGGGRMVWISTRERVKRHEAMPCTGPKDPINFEIFSAGASVAGLKLNSYERRCETSTLPDEVPANFTSYLYGHCQIAQGETGCPPPLQIQSFPACQRSLADYTLEGEPLAYRELPKIGGARVVEIDLMGERRLEVYTGSTTIVIFAATPELAREALTHLTPQEAGKPPATSVGELKADPDTPLAPPSEGAIEGEMPCRS
jgi:hypothetical protein